MNPNDVELIYELSPMQQAMLFHSLYAPGSGVYVIQQSLRLTGPLDAAALERSWQTLVERHGILRTAFFWEDLEKPLQVVHKQAALELMRESWRELSADQQRERLRQVLAEDLERSFDLTEPPLFRLALYELDENVHQLIWSYHHLLSDGWSQGLLLQELFTAYAAYAQGREPALPRTRPFRDYIAWLQRQDLEKAEAFWRQSLAGLTAPTFVLEPDGRPEGPHPEDSRRAILTLSPEASAALREVARTRRLTLNTLVQGAWALLLSRMTGSDDVVFGTTVSGRPADLPGVESIIGLFINTLPVRMAVPPEGRLKEWLAAFQQRQVEIRRFEHSPLVEVQRWSDLPAGTPLFDHILVFENLALPGEVSSAIPGLAIQEEAANTSTNFPLNVVVIPGARLTLTALYDAARFHGAEVSRLLERLAGVLAVFAADQDPLLGEIPVLLEAERQQALIEWNDTWSMYPREAGLPELFEQVARELPDAPALFDPQGEAWSYRRLDEESSRLARHLRRLGVGPESAVGISMERSAELILGTLAILKAGGIYVPLDASYPDERLAFMLEDTGARIVLVHAATRERFAGDLIGDGTLRNSLRVLDLDDSDWRLETAVAPGVRVPAECLAYVIYTSGSTGRPKGVGVPHRAIVRLVLETNYVRLGPGDRTGQIANISFDAATYEIWGALLTGAAVAVIPREVVLSPTDFAHAIRGRGVTSMFLTSALFTRMSREVPDAFATMSELMVGGEAVDPAAARAVLAGQPPRRLLDAYGPTESTTFATWYLISEAIHEAPEGAAIPIGRALANTTLFVLDRTNTPVPPGSPGELCIGGDGLARGYLNRPELTADRFIPHPWPPLETTGERLYRTGDLVRQRPDGAIEYLGRLDHQVKIRGFRIEPGEIEAVLAGHPEIRECAVLARQDTPGETRLVAYAVTGADPAALRAWLQERLPDYMVPTAWVVLDALPLTANGKLDRRALPAPERIGSVDADSAPTDAVEEQLAAIWAEVLGLERVGIHDDFFALGGHSLLATQVVSRVRSAFEVDLPLRDLFESPTVAELARAVRQASGPAVAAAADVELPREEGLPLSFAQQRLWLIDQLEPGNPAYNVPLAVRLQGDVVPDLLRRTFAEVVARHETLRTTFVSHQGRPVQMIASVERMVPPELAVTDLSLWPEAERQERALRLAREEARRPFDLARGPLLRLSLVRLAEREHLLLVTLHHIVSDGWSMGVLLREVVALYEAFSQGRPSPLPPLPLQYAAYAVRQREQLQGEALDEQIAYWKSQLEGAPTVLELPTDRPRPAVQTFRGAARAVQLPASLSQAVSALGRREGATPFMVLLAAWGLLLGRHAGQEDVLVGTPIAGRNRREIEDLIGFFVNTLVLRVDAQGNPSFGELLGRVRRAALDAFTHQDLPFERLVEELVPDREMAHSPLIQVLFSLQNTPLHPFAIPGLSLAPVTVDSGLTKMDLTLMLSESATGFSGGLEFNTDLFDAATAERLSARFLTLLEAVVNTPETATAELPLLLPAERHQALVEWNDARTDYPRDASLPELFASVAREIPEAPAIVDGDEVWSYRRLDEASNRLARRLRDLGVGSPAGPEATVAVSLEPSAELIAGILAVLKAGGAYVPLDAGYPDERLAYMLADAGARIALVDGRTRGRLEGRARLIQIEDLEKETTDGSPLDTPVPAESLALLIYTSGSTGQPKGVALPHRGIARLVRETNYLRLDRDDRMAHAANISFDAATLEIWGALGNGAALVVIPREVALSPADLAARLRRDEVTTLFLTTALFNKVAREAPGAFSRLRTVMFGGEAADPAAVAQALGTGAPERLLHLYGPAESTTLATWHRVREVPAGAATVPIGLPVGSSTVYVVDRRLRPVPPGVVGELCVGGDGLARGYLNRPELTAERFVPHPWAEPGAAGERLYRTGDLVRRRPDGAIEFVGRGDAQVKIRGFRIEPGEIEAVLGTHPGVRDCVVLVREDVPGVRLLAAYFTVADPDIPSEAGDLRGFLAGRLPEYMVPAAFVPLEALPLSPNGKVDRRSLPVPDRSHRGPRSAGGDFVAPRTRTEQALAEIWRQLLGLDRVGIEDGFFALGGHSLLATQVVSRIHETFGAGVEIALRDLFANPTIAGLAGLIDARGGSAAPLLPSLSGRRTGVRDAGAPAPLSFAQQRLWLIDQLDPGTPAYNVPAAVRMTGDLSIPLLERIFAEVVARHEALRTTFASDEGRPVQVIAPFSGSLATASRPWLPPRLPVTDLSGLPESELEARAALLAREESLCPFDLRRGPLLRLRLVRLAEREHLLLLTMHHIVSDGWSMGVLLREVAALYEAFSHGRPSPLPDLPLQYAEFAVWQREWLRGEILEAQLSYWKGQLAGAPRLLELPTDRPRPPVQTFHGASRTITLPAALSEAVHGLCRREGATPFMVLMAAWAVLLGRHAGQEDVLLGTPIAGRNHREIEELIGFFVNTLVLRVEWTAGSGGAPGFDELLGRVRRTALDAFSNQDLPFERLVEELVTEREMAHPPLFQVLFALQNAPIGPLTIPGLSLAPVSLESGTAKFDLTLTLGEGPSGFSGGLEYNTDLFEAATVDRLLARFLALLEAAAGAPEVPVADLPVLLPAERQQLASWNRTGEESTPGLCLHELFAVQAGRTPDAVALVHEAGSSTYAELAARAGGLARHLRALGVGPEIRVAVCLERSADLVATLLGVLAAGGAYVPVDPGYPVERRALMLEDSAAAVLVTRGALAADLPVNLTTGEARVLDLDAEPIPLADGLPAGSGVEPGHLAYVIYTSGSTGRPKGVAIEHRSAVALAGWARGEFAAEELSGVLAATSVCFDLSVFELFVPLAWGGRVILAENALALASHPAANEVRLVNTVPSAATELLRIGGLPASVRTVCLAGEPLPAALAAGLYATGTIRRVMNLYGPSEDTTYSTGALVPQNPDRSPAIGRPLRGTRAWVVDHRGAQVPPGVAGELWLAGAGLARGYLGRPELTAERFTPDPFSGSGERVYRTGDLVRHRQDGELDFLGRIDHQVKVRGFRIELGEIEAALAGQPGVRGCAVLAREDVPGVRQLVAYLAGEAEALPDDATLRSALGARLPEHMVPAVFVRLEALPLSPNGKVDRRSLPAPDRARRSTEAEYVAPRTPTEEALVEIWKELLGLERIGVDDRFFDLGGHSLLAAQVLARVQQRFGVELSLREVFRAPTVAGLAALVDAQSVVPVDEDELAALLAEIDQISDEEARARLAEIKTEEPPSSSPPVPAAAPLSFSQQRLWLIDQIDPGTSAYNVPAAVRLTGTVSAPLLARIFAEVVRRHEALRTTFTVQDGRPVQVIAPPPDPDVAASWPPLPVTDLSTLPEREALARGLAREEALRPFDLERGPLLRLALLRLAEGEHLLLVTMHHIVSDGWSMGVLLREIGALHEAFSQGRPSPLPPLPMQYADFAVWQRDWLQGAVLDEQLAWWRQELEGAPAALDLPLDRPRSPQQRHRGDSVPVRLSPALTGRVKELSRRERVTPFMLLLAVYQTLLHRSGDQEDVMVGTPVANRNRFEIEGLIGFFVNTLVLRGRFGEERGEPLTFSRVLARTRETALGAFGHQDLPFEKLVEEIVPERNQALSPLFQAFFGLQNSPRRRLSLPGLSLEPISQHGEISLFDLSLEMAEVDGGLVGALELRRDLFDRPTVARLVESFHHLLDGLLAAPERRIAEIPLLGAAERHQVVREWNDGAGRTERRASFVSLFERQADHAPDAPALSQQGRRFTYGELDRRANRLARRLRRLGIGLEARVAVLVERSPELVIAMLGILKAGGVYVPLDPAYPADRLAYMLEDSDARLLITEEGLSGRLPASAPPVLVLDAAEHELAEESAERLPQAPTADQLAYVIYTSGSTGRPKGTMGSHGALAAYVAAVLPVYGVGPGDRVLQFCSISFDTSLEEIVVGLSTGAELVLRTDAMLESVAVFLESCREQSLSVLSLPTAYWHEIAAKLDGGGLSIPASLRLIIVGGERALPERLEAWRRHAPERPRLINSYGVTESTIVSTAGDVTAPSRAEARGEVSVGRAILETEIHLVDREGAPVPIGVAGELLIGGRLLARGYLRRPDLTAERFVPHPFSSVPGARLYRTGDVARALPDGEIEVLGRKDDQVKVRGYRIELTEIEARLLHHPEIESAVAAIHDGPTGKQIVAYVVLRRALPPDFPALRIFLREALPDYMVPGAFVVLDAVPLTPNGKVDRRALPAPEARDWAGGGAGAADSREAASGDPVEVLLAGIWAEVLGIDRILVDDNFFALGGHSLLATQVVSRIRATTGVELPLRRLFEAPTLAELARAVWAAREAGAAQAPPLLPVPPEERGGDLPLSFAQQRLWLIDQLEPGSAAYNIPSAVRLTGELSRDLLERIFAEIVDRHEALRTTFASRDGRPVQVIAPRGSARPELEIADLSDLPESEREELARTLVLEEARRPFDLQRGPLLRLALARLGERDHLLLMTMHHIVSDGWSMGVLLREVGALYAAFSQGLPSPLPELPVQYADFAVWQRGWLQGEGLDQQIARWKRQLDGAPRVLELPTDRPRPAVPARRGASVPLALSSTLAEAVRALCRAQGATPFMVLLAAWGVLLGRHANQDDVLVGTPVAGRNRREVEDLIGFFVNTLVLRVDLRSGLRSGPEGPPSFGDLLGRVREASLAAFTDQDLPFERLVEELVTERDLAVSPLFQVLFTLQNAPGGGLEIPGLTLAPVESDGGPAKFDLSLGLQESAAGISGGLEHDLDLFDSATAARLVARFAALLEGAVAAPGTALADLPLLSPAERGQLLEWGGTGGEPAMETLHGRFEAQARQSPEAVAVICDGAALTYGALNDRANQLARRLRELGVGPEHRVGLCIDRSLDLLVGLLGILKSGGAYVPLDPRYPAERLISTLEDAGVRVLVGTAEAVAGLPASDSGDERILLDGDRDLLATLPDGDLPPWVDGANLAYVIYTSGSTGRPKGSLLTHGNVVRLFDATEGWFGFGAGDAWTLFHSYAFDFSVWEIWGALLYGGRLVVVPYLVSRSPEDFHDLLVRERVTVLNQTPSAFAQLQRVDEDPARSAALRDLRLVIFGGEALDLGGLAPWFARHGDSRPLLVNMYGITETTVHVTYRPVREADVSGRRSVIGVPIPDLAVHVLDPSLRLAPVGVPGELVVAGAGLARGYLGRPDLTAERFIPDPVSGRRGARAYRSGDLARHLPDGDLEYLGRIDHQMKIRGFRIEPGEIEAALGSHPEVRECVVLAREDTPGLRLLVAYVVSAETPSDAAPNPGDLRAFLAERLPDYMVPAAFVAMEALPLSQNGKVDRRALPAPDRVRRGQGEFIAPRTRTEEVLAEIWKDILGLDQVSVEDGFFELGGHSLLATQVLARIRQTFAVDLPLRDVFQRPTVAGLAELIDARIAAPMEEDEMAALLEELDSLSDEEAQARLEEMI
jgi:amino acid adenylation domain-containing protein